MKKNEDTGEKQYRTHTVKLRMTDDEYTAFQRRCDVYHVTQSKMLRTALSDSMGELVIRYSPVNEKTLSLLNDLITEGKRIGNNLNQITRIANVSGCIDDDLQKRLRLALGELSEWKYEILKKAGTAIGNTETYRI